MGLRDEMKKRQDEKVSQPISPDTKKSESAKTASPSLILGTHGVTEARRKGVTVKVVLDGKSDQALQIILRELSWMMEPASLGNAFDWIYTQANLHPELRLQIQTWTASNDFSAGSEKRTTSVMIPAYITEWCQEISGTVKIQTGTGAVLRFMISNWKGIKKTTGWRPVFSEPNDNLWTKW